MKFSTDRPYADPEAAARKLIEIANSVEAVQDGRIYIELLNGPFLYNLRGTPAEYKAGLDLAIERGWLLAARERHLCPVHASRRGALRSNEAASGGGLHAAAGNLQATQWKSGPYSVCTALKASVTLSTVGT